MSGRASASGIPSMPTALPFAHVKGLRAAQGVGAGDGMDHVRVAFDLLGSELDRPLDPALLGAEAVDGAQALDAPPVAFVERLPGRARVREQGVPEVPPSALGTSMACRAVQRGGVAV